MMPIINIQITHFKSSNSTIYNYYTHGTLSCRKVAEIHSEQGLTNEYKLQVLLDITIM